MHEQQDESADSQDRILPLDVRGGGTQQPLPPASEVTVAGVSRYSSEQQRDRVRLVVAAGLLAILGYLVVFATVEATSYPAHWSQTKEMLQIILPALTGIIGTVIGFYFGTSAVSRSDASGS